MKLTVEEAMKKLTVEELRAIDILSADREGIDPRRGLNFLGWLAIKELDGRRTQN